MQGVFKDRQQHNELDANFDDVLFHPNLVRAQQRVVAVPAAAAAAAAAAAGGAPAPAAAPPQWETVDVTSHAPMQRFSMDGEGVYFIVPMSSDGPVVTASGHWIVRYTIDDNDATIGATQVKQASPDGKSIQLDKKDALSDNQRMSIIPTPNLEYSQLHRHFLLAAPDHFEIGELFLKKILEGAERRDYEFALRMQGLQNSTINAVWACPDPESDPSDRAQMMEQFMRSCLTRFLDKAPQKESKDIDAIVMEAVQMHQQFSMQWVKEHKRCLSPSIESASEALVGMFWQAALRPAVRPDMTWKHMSRIIRRDPRLSPQFGVCLHFYMVKLEQDRGARNASYKSMSNASSANMLSINAMDAFFRSEVGYLSRITSHLATVEQRMFNPQTVDWYHAVSQLQLIRVPYMMSKKQRISNGDPVAPWD